MCSLVRKYLNYGTLIQPSTWYTKMPLYMKHQLEQSSKSSSDNLIPEICVNLLNRIWLSTFDHNIRFVYIFVLPCNTLIRFTVFEWSSRSTTFCSKSNRYQSLPLIIVRLDWIFTQLLDWRCWTFANQAKRGDRYSNVVLSFMCGNYCCLAVGLTWGIYCNRTTQAKNRR